MKKIILLFTLISTAYYGQNYSVTSFTNSYTDILPGAQMITNGVWDDPDIVIETDFPIMINGNSYDTLQINDLGCTVSGFKNGSGFQDAVNPSRVDVIDRGYDANVSQSSISITTSGFIGNRILKLQWKNVSSYGDYDNGGNAMSTNFQLWFYEQGGYIEVRYGLSNISDANIFYEGFTGVGVLIMDSQFGSSTNDVFLSGSTGFPAVTNQNSYMTGTPQAGQVYRFTPSMSIGVNESFSGDLKIFPNPCKNFLNISNITQGEYKVVDLNGRVVLSGVFEEVNQLDVSDLVRGVYLITITGLENQLQRQTFIKE